MKWDQNRKDDGFHPSTKIQPPEMKSQITRGIYMRALPFLARRAASGSGVPHSPFSHAELEEISAPRGSMRAISSNSHPRAQTSAPPPSAPPGHRYPLRLKFTKGCPSHSHAFPKLRATAPSRSIFSGSPCLRVQPPSLLPNTSPRP